MSQHRNNRILCYTELMKSHTPYSCTRLCSAVCPPPKSILVPTFFAKPTRSCLVRPIAYQESGQLVFNERIDEARAGMVPTVEGIQRLALFTPSRWHTFPSLLALVVALTTAALRSPSPVEEQRELPMPAGTSSSRHRRS